MNNNLTEKEYDYGVYAIVKGLPGAGIHCNKHGTESIDFEGISIPLCKEHLDKMRLNMIHEELLQ
jgi:hypothetical protein